jgi:hypothetical protein
MGLMHDHPMQEGSLVTVQLPTGGSYLELDCTTQWCTPIDDGLFVSGCAFDSISAAATLSLVTAVVREEFNRRVQQRYPFFRPARLVFDTGQTYPAYCRDISRSGLGLMLRHALHPGRVVIEVEVDQDTEVEISLDIRWCHPAGHAWYLAGAKYASVWMDEASARLM